MQNLHNTNNTCSVEFDPYDFYAKDLLTKKQNISSKSLSELYPFINLVMV